MSNPSDISPTPCGQTGDQTLRNHSIYTQLMETVLSFMKLMTGDQQQDPALEEQKDSQASREQEALLGHLMIQTVKHLQSGVTGGHKFQLPCPSMHSRDNVRGGQQAQSSRKTCRDTFISSDLSSRGLDISSLYHSSFQDYNTYQGNKYDKKNNTLGFINLGTSENKLCIDLLTERLRRSDMNYVDDNLLQYPDWRGQPFLRKEVAQFLTTYCKAPAHLDPENVVVLNSCSSVLSSLAMVLCDPGEAFLVPTPFSSGFIFSACLYAKVELLPVHLDSWVSGANTSPFQLSVGKLEQVLFEAKMEGKKVRGLLLTNPQNPLGDVYSRDSLMDYLEFAKRYHLHVIIDEIYMLTVFDEAITFHSVLSIESLPDPSKTHVIWGTSKDFGISGLCFGALHTFNKAVASAVSSFGSLHSISSIAQYKLRQLLQDREWLDSTYLPINHFRLRTAHKYITNELKALNVPFLNRGSGLFVWINLRKYLHPCTFEEELLLHRHFLDKKLILSPGKSFMCKDPGWFRLVFADNHLLLRSAMHRFHQVLLEQERNWTRRQLEDAIEEDLLTSNTAAATNLKG
uniref:AlkB homolog 3, alpha-ketoglutarate dependent dioxygenase n=1 Tax=Sus scrofa TaxID=9823 RepID=A0A8D0ZH31_PIG